ncbi:hypothetical protein CRYUN_Cryun36dG0046800 [Craigia yunnanensis]
MGDKNEVLEAVVKETMDLENIPIEEVFKNLRCSKKGLTIEATEERLTIFGHNKLEEKKGKPPNWQDLLVSLPCLSSTPPLVLLRKTML